MASRQQRVLGASIGPAASTSSPEENSKFRVGDDLFILLDEVLNNSIRAILIYDDFSGNFSDMDAIALASVLRYNTSVLSINMCGVEIGDHAVSLLCDAMSRSKIRVVDFSDTFLAEESGVALAALVSCNPNIRTVVVDETLIPEEMMDEIDLACLNNDTLYDVPPPPPIDPDRARYCVRYCFGVCPNGEYCSLIHRSITLIGRDEKPGGTTTDAASKGRSLELPPLPELGASWKTPRKKKKTKRVVDGVTDDDDDTEDEEEEDDDFAPDVAAAMELRAKGYRRGGEQRQQQEQQRAAAEVLRRRRRQAVAARRRRLAAGLVLGAACLSVLLLVYQRHRRKG